MDIIERETRRKVFYGRMISGRTLSPSGYSVNVTKKGKVGIMHVGIPVVKSEKNVASNRDFERDIHRPISVYISIFIRSRLHQ